MADRKMDAGKATAWIKSVREEVDAVNTTLSDVRDVCKTFPGDGDTIFLLIEKTGGVIEDTWNHATKIYKEAWEKVEEGIKHLTSAGEKVADFFEDLKSKIK